MMYTSSRSPLALRAAIQPAFSDPVRDAQQSFRTALKAMAEPGIILPLSGAPALDALQPAAYALCLTLFDSDTPVWLSPRFDSETIRTNLAFHCSCTFTAQREQARFALLDVEDLQDLSAFDSGSERYPDQSCTLIIQLDKLTGGSVTDWKGPGIDKTRQLYLPVPAEFWRQRALRSDFPRGLDILIASKDRVIALPRTTRVTHPLVEAVPCT